MADAWDNSAADYGNSKSRRSGGGGAGGARRILLLLLEPTILLPIVVLFLVGGVLFAKSRVVDETAVHHAVSAGLNVISSEEARMRRQHEEPKKIVHVAKTKSEHKNDAYPCDDYDDCTACVKGGCGWCLGQGWCVEDMPGICQSVEDHIGRATGHASCPANAKSGAEIEAEIAKKLLGKVHPEAGGGGVAS